MGRLVDLNKKLVSYLLTAIYNLQRSKIGYEAGNLVLRLESIVAVFAEVSPRVPGMLG